MTFSESVNNLKSAMTELSQAFCCALGWHCIIPMDPELNPLTDKREFCANCGVVR